jgi:prophage antirepressor-like protein
MTTSIVQFQFGFSDVRVVLINGEPWLVAKDLCEVLGIKNHSDACDRLDEDEKDIASTDTLGGSQGMVVISESGFYRLVMTSRKLEVRKFQKWVTSVVIPSIRKTGVYSIAPEISVPKPLLIEQSEKVAQSIERIQSGLGRSNPRLAQLLVDIGVNDFIESNQPKLAASQEFPEDKWYGLVQIASKMGIATNESTRVKLGQYFSNAIKRGDLNVERVREERLCNGQQESIWCYRDNDVVRAAIEAWKKQLS